MSGEDIAGKCSRCSTFEGWTDCVRESYPTLYSVRRLFTLLARYMFSDPDRLAQFSSALSCLAYNQDGGPGISIQPASVVNPGNTENVPGILVEASDEGLQLKKLAMSPEARESGDYSATVEMWQGDVTIQFRCMNLDGDVACLMADALLMFLTAIRKRVLSVIPWMKEYEPVGETAPVLKKSEQDDSSATRWYESVVSVRISFIYSVYNAIESKRLKDFSMHTSGEA